MRRRPRASSIFCTAACSGSWRCTSASGTTRASTSSARSRPCSTAARRAARSRIRTRRAAGSISLSGGIMSGRSPPFESFRHPSMTMLQRAGPSAETAFRLAKLRERLRERVPAIDDVAARYVHYLHLERALDERGRRVLDALLAYGEPRTAPEGVPAEESSRTALYVVPRLGTISPWASKATDIARMCALPVQRIERGRVYLLDAQRPLSDGELARIAALLHDRMTETLLVAPPSEGVLFAEHRPRPGEQVDLL